MSEISARTASSSHDDGGPHGGSPPHDEVDQVDSSRIDAGVEVLGEIYRELTPLLRKWIPARLSSEAEDIIQETMMHLWRVLTGVSAGNVRDVHAYAAGIARKKLLRAIRDTSRRGKALVLAPAHAGARSRGSVDPERRLLILELHGELQRALEAVKERERSLVCLRFLEDLRHTEACRKLAMDPAQGSRALHRTIIRLRSRLHRYRAPLRA